MPGWSLQNSAERFSSQINGKDFYSLKSEYFLPHSIIEEKFSHERFGL